MFDAHKITAELCSEPRKVKASLKNVQAVFLGIVHPFAFGDFLTLRAEGRGRLFRDCFEFISLQFLEIALYSRREHKPGRDKEEHALSLPW